MTINIFTNRPAYDVPIEKDGVVNRIWQAFFDSVFQKLNSLLGASLPLNAYTVAQLEGGSATILASSNTNGAVIVSDESGGRTIATSDGTDWRRVSDGAVIS